jgi:hypothetical protein
MSRCMNGFYLPPSGSGRQSNKVTPPGGSLQPRLFMRLSAMRMVKDEPYGRGAISVTPL